MNIFLKHLQTTNIKLSKTQISKIIQSGTFLDKFLGQLMKVDLKLMKNVIKRSAKSVFIPLGLTDTASTVDAGIHKTIIVPGRLSELERQTKKLIISDEEMNDILKIIESFEESSLLMKGVTKTIENETKEQSANNIGILLTTLKGNSLGYMLPGKGREVGNS